MKDQGVGSWIERRARIAPDRLAVVSGETSYTYAELSSRVRRLAHGLRRLGVQRGDRVGWLGPNHPAFLESLFASARLGAVLSPLNHRLDQAAIGRMLEDSAPRVVVVESSVATLPLPPGVQARLAVGGAAEGAVDYERLVAESPDDPVDERIGLDDLCMLPFTSGTTGRSKGVMLTHGNITWNVVNFLSSADFRTDDVTIAIAPLFRVGGTGVNVLPVLFKGGTVVVPRAFEPDEALRLVERHRVTIGFGNPDLLDALARSPLWPTVDLSSIRMILTGGAPAPERLIRTYFDRGLTFVQGYGLSEAAPLVLLLDQESALRKAGSAGKPPLLVDVRIVRSDETPCRPGETGELLVRGPNVMAGYWNRPDATRLAIDEEGWLRTGDAARADAEGYIWIVDRLEDAFVSSGMVVYPGDVERVLARHPAVAEAAVVGVSSGEGEVGAAFVVLATGMAVSEEELLAFCRERLDPYQVPASVTFLEGLPRSSVGKLLHPDLRRHSPQGAESSLASREVVEIRGGPSGRRSTRT
jgi:acyl-CoA synthetase (AMP-forming)/AMP-acid ligase II